MQYFSALEEISLLLVGNYYMPYEALVPMYD